MRVMRAVKARLRNRGVRRGLVIVAALILIFEVTVRRLPPDGVTVTAYPQDGGYTSATYAVTSTTRAIRADTAQKRAEIDTLNNDFNTGPFTTSPYFLTGGCGVLGGWINYQVTFTWHGLPLQSWTSLGDCGNAFADNSGGIPPDWLWGHRIAGDGQMLLWTLTQ